MMTIGVDFGKRVDNSAICVFELISVPITGSCERCKRPVKWHLGSMSWWCGYCSVWNEMMQGPVERLTPGVTHYQSRVMERLDTGIPYPQQIDRIGEVFSGVKARCDRVVMLVDCTGVGEGPADSLIAEGIPLVPVYLTSGDRLQFKPKPARDVRCTYGKAALAGRLMRLSGERRMRMPSRLPKAPEGEIEILRQQIETFGVKVDEKTGHEHFESLHSGEHDDYVIAITLAGTVERKMHVDWRRAATRLMIHRRRRVKG